MSEEAKKRVEELAEELKDGGEDLVDENEIEEDWRKSQESGQN